MTTGPTNRVEKVPLRTVGPREHLDFSRCRVLQRVLDAYQGAGRSIWEEAA